MSLRNNSRAVIFQGVNQTIPGSTGLGVYPVGNYSRFVGAINNIGSLTLRWASQLASGTSIVASSIVINSGTTIFDQVNYGPGLTEFTITACNSQPNVNYYIVGEPTR